MDKSSLRTDRLHAFLDLTVLNLSARPTMEFDLDENHEPWGVLYLGGIADL